MAIEPSAKGICEGTVKADDSGISDCAWSIFANLVAELHLLTAVFETYRLNPRRILHI